jgi:peptidoglycan hydrolase-like protein with peptidoglycan-binding domain
VYYCNSCGEVGDGRFCRMCGAPLSSLADQSGTVQLASVAATQVTGAGTGTGIGSEFDGLFRSEDGSHTPFEQTRMLQQIPGAGYGGGYGTGYEADYAAGHAAEPGMGVSGDYRMQAPGLGSLPAYAATATIASQSPQGMPAGEYPPPPGGYDERWEPESEDEHEGPRKGVIYGTLGAVALAIAVIGALLYFGTPNAANSTNVAGGLSSTPAGSGQTSQAALVLPSAAPTTAQAAPTTSAAQPTAGAPNPAPPRGGNSALPLSLGSTGNLVKYVQERLDQLQFYNGPDNGDFDQATALAVQQFQGAAKVQGDPAGVVGRSTMTALVAAGSQPDLRMSGGFGNSADTKRLQEALDYAEGAGLSANGNFNNSTRNAVVRYQNAVGLAPTGQVDAQTWAKLQSGTLAN